MVFVSVHHLFNLCDSPGGLCVSWVGTHVEANEGPVGAHGQTHELKVLGGKVVTRHVEDGQFVVRVADDGKEGLGRLREGERGRKKRGREKEGGKKRGISWRGEKWGRGGGEQVQVKGLFPSSLILLAHLLSGAVGGDIEVSDANVVLQALKEQPTALVAQPVEA